MREGTGNFQKVLLKRKEIKQDFIVINVENGLSGLQRMKKGFLLTITNQK